MPNKRWNSMHGNDKSGGGHREGARGSPIGTSATPVKTAAWPGVPGKTQSKDRSAGIKKTGKKGSFYVKQTGL